MIVLHLLTVSWGGAEQISPRLLDDSTKGQLHPRDHQETTLPPTQGLKKRLCVDNTRVPWAKNSSPDIEKPLHAVYGRQPRIGRYISCGSGYLSKFGLYLQSWGKK